ncbi:MAG: hypothetical protein ACKVZJ_09685 [Phycisphaerales bacterium]
MALLRHTLPDGSHHFDWVLGLCSMEAAQAEPDRRDAVTFRVAERVDVERGADGAASQPRLIEGERLPDHRRRYLWYEGEVEGGRGCVERVAAGWWRPDVVSADEVKLCAAFEGRAAAQWLWTAR